MRRLKNSCSPRGGPLEGDRDVPFEEPEVREVVRAVRFIPFSSIVFILRS